MNNLYSEIGNYAPDNLIAGSEFPILTKGISLASGYGELKRGTVIAIINSSELAVPVDNSKNDGSENPYGILTDNIDTGINETENNITSTAYISGLFNSKSLIFKADNTLADYEERLRELGIFIKKNI